MSALDTKQEIAEIRKALKRAVPTVSVRNGRGTAWGWVEISGSGEYGTFTELERARLTALGLSLGGNFSVIAPDARGFWHKKLTGQVATGQPCLVCHQPGTERFFCPCDLAHWLCIAHAGLYRDCAFVQHHGERS